MQVPVQVQRPVTQEHCCPEIHLWESTIGSTRPRDKVIGETLGEMEGNGDQHLFFCGFP